MHVLKSSASSGICQTYTETLSPTFRKKGPESKTFFKIDEFIVDHRAEQIFTLTVNISVWDHWKVLGKALLLLLVPADVVVGVDGGGVGDAVLQVLVALHCFLLLCQWAPPSLLLLVSILIAGVPEQKELQNQRLMKALWYIDYSPRLPA